jgi:hypothetical protein
MKKPRVDKGKPVGSKSNGLSDGLEIIDIADLLPDDKNARRHTPHNIGMIANALQEVGTGRSGVIDEKGKVLAGNATLEALAQAGIRRVKVVESNGEEWVVVRRTGLNANQKKRLALYDNRTGEFAEWNLDVLKEFSSDDLLKGMWSDQEVTWIKEGWVGDEASLKDGYDPETDTFVIKIMDVARADKDKLVDALNGAIQKLKLEYKAEAF